MGKEKIQKIAITGGKGGTGKSTFSVLLANKLVKLGHKVALVDVDVECPNDYLLLNQKLKKKIGFTYAKFPKIDKRKCRKCGLCVKSCKSNAIFQAPGQYPIFLPELCSGCGVCWLTCPYGAIKPREVKTGEIFINQVNNNLWLITGLAKAGLEETGPVVAQVKKIVLNFAEKMNIDMILFDTAAGTHCPVIQALINVDFAYAVTEPTPMGAYDLGLLLELSQKLKIRTKVILNKANLGNKKFIEKIVNKYKVKIASAIPYDKNLAKAYSNGQLLDLDYDFRINGEKFFYEKKV